MSTTTSAPANAAPAATKKTPSPSARKLLQKLTALHPSASLESRQTISNWMVFNRKKCEGMGEGLLLAVESASAMEEGTEAPTRLLLLLKITHQVLLSNCPTGTAAATTGVDGDKWTKSSQLRSRLGEIAIIPLWKALATSLDKLNQETQVQYQSEVKGMMEEWKSHHVFGGPTVMEEYKKGWIRALKEAAGAASGEDNAESPFVVVVEELTKIEPGTNKVSFAQAQVSTIPKESNQNDNTENANINYNTDAVVEATASSVVEGRREGKVAQAIKRDSIASVDVEVDFEGVDEARVPPSRFLDACKVIASIQITRDLGSDFAMTLSSSLSSIPPDVDKACSTILMQRKNGQDETPVTELLPSDSLSTLPDDLLNLDLKYARQSLQTYKETIRQQRKARLQCLELLLQSRCSFGSMDAARSFCGGDDSDVNMDNILDKLKKRKEILVDAMALEGLDVEEDEEEKKMEKDEELLKPLDWFTEAEKNKVEEEPDTKKLKSC